MSDHLSTLYKLKKHNLHKAGAVLADTFKEDPIWSKIFEGIPETNEKRVACFETPMRFVYKYGHLYATSDKLEGIAAWLPGETADMTWWRMIRSGAMQSGMKAGWDLGKKLGIVFEPLQHHRKNHMKEKSYSYLFIIGVNPKMQRKGYGSKLLNAIINLNQTENRAIYLETTSEQNVGMYKRFGFKLLNTIQLPLINLPMWEMILE